MTFYEHTSKSDKWYTPDDVLERVRRVFSEGIDLDPASDMRAQRRVRARRYYHARRDGLAMPWIAGNVFVNPPGGKRGNQSLVGLFWRKLMEEREARSFDHAIYLGFSIKVLGVAQKYHAVTPLEFPVCVPSDRIAFVAGDGQPQDAPGHVNAIVYVPCRVDARAEFMRVFGEMGAVTRVW